VPAVALGKRRLEIKSSLQEGTMTGTEMRDFGEFGLTYSEYVIIMVPPPLQQLIRESA
jgi:hypothetical protein